MIKITFPDNSVREYAKGTTAMQIAESGNSAPCSSIVAVHRSRFLVMNSVDQVEHHHVVHTTVSGLSSFGFMLGPQCMVELLDNAILPVRINKHVVPLPLLNTVTTFTLFYLLCGFAGCFLLTFFGIDFLEALTSSLSAMGNTGLGFGYYGPAYTMSSMPDVCQWIMSFLMLIGRLELFSVLILFSPVFWKEW